MYQHQEPTLAQRIIGRFVWLLRDSEFEFAEFLSSFAMLSHGIWLLAPWWHTFASSPSYHAMAYVAPEWAWGLVMALIGAAQMAAFVGEHRLSRVTAAWGGIFIWGAIALMFWLGNPDSTGALAYLLFCLASAWALWRLAAKH
jgi:drug/metabolite transporter superfamily protein YnfA